MSAIDPNMIAKLLKEEAEQPTSRTGTRGSRKPKVDLTEIREINIWMKLPHHICLPDCEHRSDPNNKTADVTIVQDQAIINTLGNACWNPECMDKKRNKETDRGTNIVATVKNQNICRYCFIGGYLR